MNKYFPICISILFIALSHSFHSNGQNIITVAGTGSTFGGDGGPATAAGMSGPLSGCFDRAGNYYFVDQSAERIRKIDVLGTISTVAGNGTSGYTGDGFPATNAELADPNGVATDTSGNLYIADQNNNRIRKVNAVTGMITTFAGTGTSGFSGEGGQATAANIAQPLSVVADRFGNIYMALSDHRIRKVNSAGIITTIAGTGTGGFDGDGAPAISALLSFPCGLAVDDTGDLYFAEIMSYCNRVRKINMSGIISTVVGNGSATYTGDGVLATMAAIAPNAVAVDALNNLFITDKVNQRVYKVDAVTHILHRIAGNGTPGDTGDDGPATAATLYNPIGVAVDMCGNPYVANFGGSAAGTGRRIRKIQLNDIHPPVTVNISVVPGDTVCAGRIAVFTANTTGSVIPLRFDWFVNGFAVAGSADTYTYTPNNGDVVGCAYTYREQCSGDTLIIHDDQPVWVVPVTMPAISLTATTPVLFGATVTVNATVTNAGSGYHIKWMNNGVLFAITSAPSITYVKLGGIDTITAMVFSASPQGCYDSVTAAPAYVNGLPVGVRNVADDHEVIVYPNPAHNMLAIGGAIEQGAVTIANMAGQLMVYSRISETDNRINITSLPPGIYVVTVTLHSGTRVVTKLVKE